MRVNKPVVSKLMIYLQGVFIAHCQTPPDVVELRVVLNTNNDRDIMRSHEVMQNSLKV